LAVSVGAVEFLDCVTGISRVRHYDIADAARAILAVVKQLDATDGSNTCEKIANIIFGEVVV